MAIVDVIKYGGSPEVFAWKYPSEELGTWTQLIVNESQEAVLFKGGRALDAFTSGRHTLDTANIPLLNKLVNLPFGGRSPFTAEVWFVNKVCSLDIKWGTASPIQLQDPKYKVFVPVRAFGQFGIQIEDSKRFLVKMVGTLPTFDKTNITKYFKGFYLTKVKDSISSWLVDKQIGITDINASIDEISADLQEAMRPMLAEYGIRLINFYVNDISVPEDDPAVKKLKEALAKKAEMNILGYSYQQERSFDTLETAAGNSGAASGLMGAGMGLGMGTAVGGAFGNQLGGIAKELNTTAEAGKKCPSCGAKMSNESRFCQSCGLDTAPLKDSGTAETVCGGCGTRCDKNQKFCPECGRALKKTCPSCKQPVAESEKFCHECGAKLI